jgi:hypothetical protein
MLYTMETVEVKVAETVPLDYATVRTDHTGNAHIQAKIDVLRGLKDQCLALSKAFKAKFRKTKRIDELIDGWNTLLQSASISMTIIGMSVPPLLVGSSIAAGVAFVSGRVQDKYNFKSRFTKHRLTHKQYADLSREICAVLAKNNLTSNEYHMYIVEIQDKMSLIEDTSTVLQ